MGFSINMPVFGFFQLIMRFSTCDEMYMYSEKVILRLRYMPAVRPLLSLSSNWSQNFKGNICYLARFDIFSAHSARNNRPYIYRYISPPPPPSSLNTSGGFIVTCGCYKIYPPWHHCTLHWMLMTMLQFVYLRRWFCIKVWFIYLGSNCFILVVCFEVKITEK